MKLRVKRVGPVEVPLPAYASELAAGLDLSAALEAAVLIEPGARRLIPTGLILELPPGFEGQVRPRSGLALRAGITVLNSPGTIDADFRGEVAVVLVNLGAEPFRVEPLARIAQLVVAPVLRVEVEVADTLGDTKRGAGGYGSTGA
ncbi:MAG: dUTP diphosphatase [Sorangiineae bacterium]|nr:dUTP diphosphatase [Polyangiaceae bacterium]MEB2323922.1 dUTP diphosphatase [Sorangiineae bacterium]